MSITCLLLVFYHGKLSLKTVQIYGLRSKVSASTQNQTFNALLFAFRHILNKDIENLNNTVRAPRRKTLPTVLSKPEVFNVLSHMGGTNRLIAQINYGCGLRVSECLNLRVKDIEFDRGIVMIRDSKGGKDRQTVLPETVRETLVEHLKQIRHIHDRDRVKDTAGVYVPNAWIASIATSEKSGDGSGFSLRINYPLTLVPALSGGTSDFLAAINDQSSRRQPKPTSPSGLLHIHCGIVLPPICSNPAPILEPFRNYWATPTSRPP